MADKTTSQSTKPPKNGGKVAGYNPASEKLLDGHPKDAGQAIGYKLSVIIITKNEADNIRACLESVAWADEIVVVDSGSSDGTVNICKALGAQVHTTTDWPGFGIQKNRALSHATGEWVLSLDADERVTPELCSEIEAALNDPHGHAAFRVPRLSSFCGRYMRHSGWYPDYVTRLFHRGEAEFSDDLVHEQLVVRGAVGTLKQHLLHNTFHDLEQLLAKINHYSTAGAQILHEKNKTASLKKAVAHAVWAFFRTYLLRAGFLDGREGFMVAVSTAEGTYYRYTKLMLLNKR
jgi:glycosyltransferase involved in cell wall biosynthesis